MPSVTVNVPDELEISDSDFELADFLSTVMRSPKSESVKLELLRSFTAESDLSQDEARAFAQELGDKIKRDRLEQRRGE